MVTQQTIYRYMCGHVCMQEQLINKKKSWIWKWARRGIWECLEGGKGSKKRYNYVLRNK